MEGIQFWSMFEVCSRELEKHETLYQNFFPQIKARFFFRGKVHVEDWISCEQDGLHLIALTTDASELERAHGRLLTHFQFGFLSLSPSWHPVPTLHCTFQLRELDICGRLKMAADSFFHQEEWDPWDLPLNLGWL